MTKPFNIESADINRLNDIQLTQLLSQLLQSEAYRFGIAQRSAEVALNIRVGDGGEDGRISWSGPPEQTDYLPNRLTMFQNKATDMVPSAYANEIMTSATRDKPSALKPKVEEVLDRGGAYIIFTTQELNSQQKDERIAAVRAKLREQKKGYADTCEIGIYDASKIAAWVNQFIPAVVSVQNWTGRPIERGLKTYSLWSEHEDLSRFPYAVVDSRKEIIEALSQKLEKPKSCFRIMGLSGLGKTRTAFELIKGNEAISSLVVYVDANHCPNIDGLVSDWVGLNLRAIVIVDNCEYRLHESLAREIRRENSQLSLLTLDYNFDSVSHSTVCFKLNPMADEELLLLLSPAYKEKLPDLRRVVAFAQGFPQMAVLLAEARLSEDPQIGALTEDELANKLLWRRGEAENSEKLRILQACSLFDVFGVEKEAENQLIFIAKLVGVDVDRVFECVMEYSERGLIDRRGRFGQVVPKPLAIRLAGQWWNKSRKTKQLELINEIPDDMVDGFCLQVEKMDFHTDVKKLTEQLCGPKGPFGQAEVILSIRGSRLFRSFVIVNPESTSQALSKTLKNLPPEKLLAIKDDVRRNLVWALEMLCYHADIFPESAWCMLLLAVAENESWSNNATGMFAQLFRVRLSGTASKPEARFSLLRKALDLNRADVDMVVLNALSQAIKTYGGSRTVGAEHQGTKAPLEEWQPKIWQEVFDYWQESFNLMLILLERGDLQKQKVLSEIGYSIRSFVAQGRIKMLDTAIRQIVTINGRYWPAALDSIKDAFKYDTKGMKQEAERALSSWLELLSPANADLPEKLKILVLDPPWEHQKGKDGHYVDVASENAKTLARELANNINELLPYIHLLFQGAQKQSYSFGCQLAHGLADIKPLLDLCFDRILSIQKANPNFMLGIYRGVYENSAEEWQRLIDRLLVNEQLVYLYPEFIRTGSIQKSHLDILLDLIRRGSLSPNSANALCYGSVANDISHDVIATFCLGLAEIGEQASWAALNVIYMYCFGNKGSIEKLRKPLKTLVTAVPLHKDQHNRATDVHHWHDLAEKLLNEPDEEFAVDLVNQLVAACQNGLNHGDIWSYIKPLLLDLMCDYGELLWPIFGEAIIRSKGMERYWLQQLLDRENSFHNQMPSVLSAIPVDSIIEWCEKHPDIGPGFVAGCVNVLESTEEKQRPSPLFVALLEKFGDDKHVIGALNGNMVTRGWSGSLVPYLKSDKEALSPLLDSDNGLVRRWIRNHIEYIDRQIDEESMKDEERDIGLY